MPRSSRPRKAHKPRPPRIPLADGPGSPIQQMRDHLHAGLLALESGLATGDNLQQLAQLLNTLYWVEQNEGRHSPVIEGGMRALQELIDRYEPHCRIVCSTLRYEPIRIAVAEIIERLPRQSVDRIYLAMQQMRAQPGAPIAGAAR